MGIGVNDSSLFFNSSLTFSEASSQDTIITFLLCIVLALIFLVGTAGNMYTLVLMNIATQVTGNMYVYIVNLALADLLYLSTIPFVVCTYYAKDWYFGSIGCRVLFSLDFLTMHASIFMLTVMSMERYVAVLRPLDTLTRSRHYRRAVTCTIWFVSFVLSVPAMIMIELRTNIRDGVEKHICHPTWQMTAYKAYLTFLFNTCILAPGCIIGYLYLKLARTYWRSQTSVLSPTKVSSGGTKCPKQKVLYMIFGIVLTYWACFVPFWVWQLLSVYYFEHRRLSHKTMVCVNFIMTCLAYSNSCINPFLYTLLTRNYQDYLRDSQKCGIGFKKRFNHSSQRSVSSGSHQFTL